MTLDVNEQLRARLNSELQRIGLLPSAVQPSNPNVGLTGITNRSNSSDQLEFKQSLTNDLENKEVILLNLFREFTKKDEGKVLVAELGKFARFAQSEVAKSSKEI